MEVNKLKKKLVLPILALLVILVAPMVAGQVKACTNVREPRYTKIPICIQGQIPDQFPTVDDSCSWTCGNRVYFCNNFELDGLTLPISDQCVFNAYFCVTAWVNTVNGNSALKTSMCFDFSPCGICGGFQGDFVMRGTDVCLDNLAAASWHGCLDMCGTGQFCGTTLKLTICISDGQYSITGCLRIPTSTLEQLQE